MRVSLLLIFLLSLPLLHAQEGLELLEVPQGSISQVESYLEAKIENIGYDRVFVALPQGWEIDPVEYYVRAYPVRESNLWRIYSTPKKYTDLLRKGYVFRSTYIQTKQTTDIAGRKGWWLKPNEGIVIKLKLSLPASGEVDPLKIQKQHPDIIVRSWKQEFILKVASPGIIEAPWVVKGATLISASPAPLGDTRKIKKNSNFYYVESYREKYRRSYDVPDWDEWIPLRNPLALAFKPSYSLDSFPEISQPGEVETVKPVWRVDDIRDITYEYEWKQGRTIEGIKLYRDDFANLPAWFEWFYAG